MSSSDEEENYELVREMLLQGDRFIGNRNQMNMGASQYNMSNQYTRTETILTNRAHGGGYSIALTKCLFGEGMIQAVENEKILTLRTKAPRPCVQYHESIRLNYAESRTTPMRMKKKRIIDENEYRTLSAPGLLDSFQSHPLDWSGDNTIAVALGSSLYYWSDDVKNHSILAVDNDNVPITCVSWAPGNTPVLCVATNEGVINLWDVEREAQVRVFRDHCDRVSCASWHGAILSTGSHDKSIINWDVRIRDARISAYHGHHEEVNGIAYNVDGSQLVSGGADRLINLWDTATRQPILLGGGDDTHMASIKALAWCPWQSNLLVTGGGMDDGMIKFWNTRTGVMLDCVETGQQVMALRWYGPHRELISAHGYMKPCIIVWRYPTMDRIVEFTSHEARIIGISLSPDNQILLSASADETLKFWRLIEPVVSSDSHRETPIHTIR